MTTPQDNGGPAFPTTQKNFAPEEVEFGSPGMSLRDYFAAAALPTLLAQLGSIDKEAARSEVESGKLSWYEIIKATDADIIVPKYDVAAFGAYLIADAMLAARKEGA